jgi:hypothetical protein
VDSDALRLGVTLGELALAGTDKCTFIVAPQVASFGIWVEQLVAESTGKKGRGTLPVVCEPLGSPSKYGHDRLFVQIRFEGGGEDAEDDAVIGALSADERPIVVIDLEDGHDLGREFFSWEFAVAVAGHVLDVNPFDEPNVQESKDNTARTLGEFAATGMLDIEGIDDVARPAGVTTHGIDPLPLNQSVGALLAETRQGDYVAITAFLEQTERTDEILAETRAIVRDALGVATTLGYGPRYLHSTGQYHKGGPPQGVFLQITSEKVDDVPVPGRQLTFGQLNRAQSIGDLQALVAHGRPALRVHLGDDVIAGLVQLREAVRAALSAVPARR